MRKTIIVVGGVNVDLILTVPRFPKPGESMEGDSFQKSLGGKAANQAVGVARLGANACLLSKVGDDDFGDWLLDKVDSYSVDTSAVLKVDECSSGVAMILVDQTGQNSIAVTSGAYALLSPQDIADRESQIAGASALMTTLETPIEACIEAFSVARAHGVITVLDPGPVSHWDDRLLPLADVVTPNETELQAITGIEVSDRDSCISAMEAVEKGGARNVIAKLGEDGAMGLSEGKLFYVPAVRVPKVVDTTGAGDAFNAAMTFALSEGASLEEAAKYAACAGAIAVTRAHAAPAMPSKEEVDQLHSRAYSK